MEPNVPQPTAPTWIETSPTRSDLIGAQGVILGSVIRSYGRWDAEFVDTKAHSPNLRRPLGRHETEAQARAAVQIELRLAAIRTAVPPTHIIRFTIPHTARSTEDVLSETRVGDTAASVVEYLGTGQLDRYVLTEVYALDLTPGALALTDVTAPILRDVAAYVEAAAIELPASLDDAFTRHGIPQPTAWIEANALRDLDFEDERLGPADCLDRRRAA